MATQFEFGQTCQDVITGFRGVVIGRFSHITGCDQYLLASKADEKSDKVDRERFFDVTRLTLCDVPRVLLPHQAEILGEAIRRAGLETVHVERIEPPTVTTERIQSFEGATAAAAPIPAAPSPG